MTRAQLLAVRAKIEQGWTRFAWARNERGDCVVVNAPEASCWCLGGAALAVDIDRRALARRLGFERVEQMVGWNDKPERTKEEVLERIDRALGHGALEVVA